MMLIEEMGLCKADRTEFAGMELSDWYGRKTSLQMISKTSEKTTNAASDCSLVWRTADCCRRGDWRMEMTSLGLCQ